MKIRKKVQVSLKESFEELLHNIKSIPGKKVLTISCLGDNLVTVMEESGQIALPQSEETLFLARLTDALQDGGGLIIRQVLPSFIETTSPDGQKMVVQETRFYGVGMGKKNWKPMSKEEIQKAKCRDPKTGQISPPAPGVSFGEIQKVKPV
ncbi:MAG: hypothetical protein ACHQYP_12580 [Nitrospiria bacterium]